MSELTYPEVGLTRGGPLPAGYRHLRYRTAIGTGPVVFARAGAAILTFAMHRATGARIRTAADRAAPGVRLTVGLGPLRVPCEVVWAADRSDLIGFGYGTLPGHQASGEESFTVERDEHDRVFFAVTAFSRPARLPMRLGGPVAVLFQHSYARLCARAVKRLATVAP